MFQGFEGALISVLDEALNFGRCCLEKIMIFRGMSTGNGFSNIKIL